MKQIWQQTKPPPSSVDLTMKDVEIILQLKKVAPSIRPPKKPSAGRLKISALKQKLIRAKTKPRPKLLISVPMPHPSERPRLFVSSTGQPSSSQRTPDTVASDPKSTKKIRKIPVA